MTTTDQLDSRIYKATKNYRRAVNKLSTAISLLLVYSDEYSVKEARYLYYAGKDVYKSIIDIQNNMDNLIASNNDTQQNMANLSAQLDDYERVLESYIDEVKKEYSIAVGICNEYTRT